MYKLLPLIAIVLSTILHPLATHAWRKDKAAENYRRRIELAQILHKHENTAELVELMRLIEKNINRTALQKMEEDLQAERQKKDRDESPIRFQEMEKRGKVQTYQIYRTAAESAKDVEIVEGPYDEFHLGKDIFSYELKYRGKIYKLSTHVGSSSLMLVGTEEQVNKFNNIFKDLQKMPETEKPKQRAKKEKELQEAKTTPIAYEKKNYLINNQQFRISSYSSKDHYETGFYGVGLSHFMPDMRYVDSAGNRYEERRPNDAEQAQIDQVNRIPRTSRDSLRGDDSRPSPAKK